MKLWRAIFIPLFFSYVENFKILVYSDLFGTSHVKTLAAVADTLTDAGHNVTVLMPIFNPELRNRTYLYSTKNTIFIEQSPKVAPLMDVMKDFLANLWVADNVNPLLMLTKAKDMATMFSEQCKKVLLEPGLLEKLKAENYDLAVTEPFDMCPYALFEAINIRAHVVVLSCSRLDHVSHVIGQPIAPSYVPGAQTASGDQMTMGERVDNYLQFLFGSYFFYYLSDSIFEAVKDIGSIDRSWREIVPEASFIMPNQITLLDFPAPTFDKIVPIGGLSVKTDKKSLKLEEKWSKILGIRKNNVFISFGSNAKSVDMPEEFKKSLLEVFKAMPDTTFIWKYENEKDTIVDHLDNVYLGEWLPQNELLADKRLSVFVTHGGIGSITEVALMGRPVPLFADQGRNAHMLKRHGGALVLDKNDLGNPKLVQKTLEKVINDPSYRKSAERLAEMLNNLPTNPKETLVKYVEFAARFGKLPSLDNYGRHQSYIEYFFLDIIAIGLFITLISLYVTYSVLKAIVRKLFCSKCSKSNEKNKKE